MSEYYNDYVWRGAIPYGASKLELPTGTCYKVVADPYRKRIVIEQYKGSHFQKVIYDSALLDFRHLRSAAEQTAWQKIVLSSTPEATISHIRNQEDRLVCVETCFFHNKHCIECRLASPHGMLLSIHRLRYQVLGDAFNGVVLFDANDHPVMMKKYLVHADTGEFTDLLEEAWELHEAL